MKTMRTWKGQVNKFRAEMLKPIILAKPKKAKKEPQHEVVVANVQSLHKNVANYEKYRKEGEKKGGEFLKTLAKIKRR